MTAVADEVTDAFSAALEKDAGITASAPADITPPPRRAASDDPDAPHGRNDDGTPRAPYGIGKNGRPRIKPAGPGRYGKSGEDKPRVETSAAPAAPAGKTAGKDYAPGLVATGEQLWLALSLNQGIKFGKRKAKDGTVRPLVSLPDTRPYAVVFREQLPMMAKAWSDAANQNATVRRYVAKFAGSEGDGIAWVLGVGLSSAMFAMGCATLAKQENAELRAQLAEKNDGDVQQYFQQMLELMGLAEAEAA